MSSKDEADPGGGEDVAADLPLATSESKPDTVTVIEMSALQVRVLSVASALFVLTLAIGAALWLQDDRMTHWAADPEVDDLSLLMCIPNRKFLKIMQV